MIDIDLFAGAGGLALGLTAAGFGPIELYELDNFACRTLRTNLSGGGRMFTGAINECDVRHVCWRTLRHEVRLLAAGAPCQPFSCAGRHGAQSDGRNLFPEVLRAVRDLRPRAILLENVRGLVRESFQPYFEYIRQQIECPSIEPRHNELWRAHARRIQQHRRSPGYKPEYDVSYRVLDAADYGVPQNRVRVFIVATRNDTQPYSFPSNTHSRAALVRAQQGPEYWDARGVAMRRLVHSKSTTGEPCALLPWVTVRDALFELPNSADHEGYSVQNHWSIPGAKLYPGHNGSLLDLPSKTIKAGVHGVPGGENVLVTDCGKVRYFTLREAAELQTFPYSHFFEGSRTGITKQVGNAVPCALATALARPLLRLLN